MDGQTNRSGESTSVSSAAQYACTRCNGDGRIHFSSYMAGVCFKCKGSGKQSKKPSKPTPKWAVSAIDKASGDRVGPIFYLRARSAAKALEKAKNTLAGGNGYLAETASVEAA